MFQGISLVTPVWTDGISTYPLDFRIYHKDSDGKTKNDHFQDMLRESAARGLNPDCVLFDSWYGSVDNLHLVRRLGWHFLTRLKKNRQVNPDKFGNKQIHEICIPNGGCVVHLKDCGMVKVFHRGDDGNGVQFWAKDILNLEEKTRQIYAVYAFKIQKYHRNLKRYCE
ncbi:IS701 family transposase ISMhu9 [Methanocorpusculaceae archaeon Ag1]|uniref:IS701 family transposase ISMhu9 n=2 Tax=Methanorbis furvi TaxID=3028299 RepID=A0AAE4SAK3_9EURY|nr:IS701 family transposase ISMhu9 [Methanocorpusculaceae archaeon Ag1]